MDTSASSTTSRASSGSRMLRSATVDEDDGWSTDFSLSDEDMGETYLDHVEVSFLSTSNAMIIHGGVHFFRHDFFISLAATATPLRCAGRLRPSGTDRGRPSGRRYRRSCSRGMRRMVVRPPVIRLVPFSHFHFSQRAIAYTFSISIQVGNSSSQEGWAPSAYLETAPAPTIKSPCSSGGTPSPSVSSQDSEHDHLQ